MMDQFGNLSRLKEVMTLYGQDLMQAMVILVAGLVAIQFLLSWSDAF